MLAGTFFSNIGLAVSDYAKQKKVLFLAAEPLTDAITLSKGNRYTFRLRPSNYEQAAMLADEAAKLPAKKWATIAPNYEYGQSAVAVFKKLLSAKRARHPMGRRAMAAAGQDRRRRRRRGDRQDRARGDPQRLLRPRPRQAGARRQHARPVQGSRRRRLPHRRARISGSAEGRDADRLDRHRLPLGRRNDPRARGVPESLSGQIQRLSAARLGRRLFHDQGRRGDPRQGAFDGQRKARSPPPRASSSRRRSAR